MKAIRTIGTIAGAAAIVAGGLPALGINAIAGLATASTPTRRCTVQGAGEA